MTDRPVNYLTVADIASVLKITAQSVRSLIRNGNISASRIGSQWVATPESLNDYIKTNDVYIEPDDHERLSSGLPSIVALSFFSGAMGLDIGMKRGGIDALLACEINKYCRMTIAKNNPQIALIGDIENYSAKQILSMARIPSGHHVDVIFGGPPCQAFSTAGSRRGFSDSRGNVFLRYLDVVEEIQPQYLVIENVRGLLSAEYPYHTGAPIKGGALCLILERLRNMGYSYSFNLYNAANFGTPQIRERVVIICKKGDKKVPYLTPTNSNNPQYGLPRWVTLQEAFSTLPNDCVHHYIEFPEKRLKYYRYLTEGQYWKDLPKELQEEAMGAKMHLGGGKTGFYRRLSYDKPSPTLVTNPAMPATDLCHPVENRPLSVEEYACIQEFPAEWKICGPILEQYKQIGNAVPIRLGEAIARAIIDDMQKKERIEYAGFEYSRYKKTNETEWEAEMSKRIHDIQNVEGNTYEKQLSFFDM